MNEIIQRRYTLFVLFVVAMTQQEFSVRVARKTNEALEICTFELVNVESQAALPPFLRGLPYRRSSSGGDAPIFAL